MKVSLFNPNFWDQRRLFWLFHISGWTIVTLLVYALYRHQFVSLYYYLRFFSYYIVGFFGTLLFRKRLREFAKRDFHIVQLLFRLILMSLGLTLVMYLTHVTVSLFIYEEDIPFSDYLKEMVTSTMWKYLFQSYTLLLFMIVFTWMILYFGIKSSLSLLSEKEAAREAQIQAQKAQFEMLRYQLNPHFLFNSLNSIWALVEEDPGAVKKMVNELSDFLRYSLLFDHKPFKPLAHEIEALKNYFSIEKKRFQEKLNINLEIADNAKNCRVLSFMLQPFVENAIKFGMKTSEMPLEIKITSKLVERDLIITISNTGHWIEKSSLESEENGLSGTGNGIKNVVNRLEIAYPDGYKLHFDKQDQKVEIMIVIHNIEPYEEI